MPNGVLIIGAYGTGKSSLCEELAGVLESAGMPYGAIDLDWLGWYDAPGRRLDHDRRDPVAMANLQAVVGNYLVGGRGARRARRRGLVRRGAGRDPRRAAVPAARRAADRSVRGDRATALGRGVHRRAQDLEEAKQQSERGDLGLSDVVIVNDRPIWEVADEVLDWLSWR